MKIVEQSITFGDINGKRVLEIIEDSARCCYQSSHKVTGLEEDTKRFVSGLVRSGHESTLEHVSFRARVITNRGVSHEWVRHRVGCSYSQESTRYCDYGSKDGGITVIWPWYLGSHDLWKQPKVGELVATPYTTWHKAMLTAEACYKVLLEQGCKPEMARGVLPNDLKTEFVTTMTARAWRHFFKLRCARAAHPQIRELALDALEHLSSVVPVLFDDLDKEFKNGYRGRPPLPGVV